MTNTTSYLGLCYHYIRSRQSQKDFPRILGSSQEEFIKHVEALKKQFRIIDPKELIDLHYGKHTLQDARPGILVTFDDGLSDHYLAAQILNSLGINALFFVPTCVFSENLPANPIIIHYGIAIFGVKYFLEVYNHIVSNENLSEHQILYNNRLDPWEIIKRLNQSLNMNYITLHLEKYSWKYTTYYYSRMHTT
ncbi:MAG: hypothetical protein COV29_02155 [Candidatus Yanofskybacteria bacterium CG10_big_fil_rev_8_21_14_0_10_36_16]|uniref:NodB homology domain-containing protein n=1 Tax=Candidatus Yanofskybacteria bacterium CG10_big_fil_rev_8_21_14_0_10_36_16 TaxID=1975096 RepID=A0A2J0Q7V1_9BACT|nr:MAG: hypothetical protein COV29_02155 [Candidatus Yanofskybacteria bacterium CG10_big_fil_rev_8_21_14_0_10_36_16]